MQIPDIEVIEAAHRRIGPYINHTPVFTCSSFDERLGAELFFKCENFQKVGAFKFRGACNAVFSLDEDDLSNGVATHSSGNHAQALSLAARLRGVRAYIVMPRTSPSVKVEAVRGYGGEIIFCEPTLDARQETLDTVVRETGAKFIHPYNDPCIIAGQASAAKELLEEIDSLDIIMAPVGGGGLLSGTALSAFHFSPGTEVIGAEPAGADDAFRSLQEGRIVPSVQPETIADGLLTSLGELTFKIIRAHVNEIVTVSEQAIVQAMRQTFERMKMVVEPSAAVPLGALLDAKVNVKGKRLGIIVSGGNVDLDNLPWSYS